MTTDGLPGSTQALVRVLASDGVNTTIATSAPFALGKHAPTVQIGGVSEGQRIAFGETVALLGLAADAEDGNVESSKLTWSMTGTQSATGSQFVLTDLAPSDYVATLSASDSDGQTTSASRHFTVLPLVVPDAAQPTLDGFCADAGYGNATQMRMTTGNGHSARIWSLHAGGKLYLCFSDLNFAGVGKPLTAVGLQVDGNNSGGDSLQPDDLAFWVDEDGIPYQLVGAQTKMVVSNTPKAGFAAVVEKSANGWSAELEIAENLVGGWNHPARIFLNQAPVVAVGQLGFWPLIARNAHPATWAAAYFGPLPAAENRSPVADAGTEQWVNVAVTKTITLDGRRSYDPDGNVDGNPLTFTWSQVAGPAVVLLHANSATPSFVATPLTSATTLRFQLVVSDGTLSSTSAEITATLLPTARPHTPTTFTPADGQPVNQSLIYLPLVAR